jgi:hypothetical protein
MPPFTEMTGGDELVFHSKPLRDLFRGSQPPCGNGRDHLIQRQTFNMSVSIRKSHALTVIALR